MTKGLNSKHLCLKVLELLSGIHFLIRNELIRLIYLSQQLFQVSDLETRHLSRSLKVVLGVILADLDIRGHVDGGDLLVLPNRCLS